jgi:hypothetical protein
MKTVQSLPFWACLILLPSAVHAQAIVEHSVAAGATGTAAAASKNAGKSIGRIFENLNKTMGKAGVETRSRETKRPPQSASPAAESGLKSEVPDLKQISAGVDRQEVIRKFGEPSMKVTNLQKTGLEETFWYMVKDQEPVVITFLEGKVVATSALTHSDERNRQIEASGASGREHAGPEMRNP